MAFVPTLDDPPLQELLYSKSQDPWRVAVACVLLNKTSRDQVDRVWPALFERWPTASALAYRSEDGELGDLTRGLGLVQGRARTLRRMSHEWVVRPDGWRQDVLLGYFGLGLYAQESHRVFVCGDLSVVPEDRVVGEWVRLMRQVPAWQRPVRYRAWVPAHVADGIAAG